MANNSTLPKEEWKRLATELFPEMKNIYEQEDSAWQVLFDLLQMAVEAHKINDTEKLNTIYQFTRWCYAQKDIEPELWTAAFAAFYEHLVDDPITLNSIPVWVEPEIFQEMLRQFKRQLELTQEPERFQQLLKEYDLVNSTNFSKQS